MTQVSTKITIASFKKKSLPFEVEHISISEAFDRHHTFEITASLGIGKSLSSKEVGLILGEYIDIEITTKIPKTVVKKVMAAAEADQSSGKLNESTNLKTAPTPLTPKTHSFRGITDSLALFQQGEQRMIRIEGYSPTILMDSAPSFRAFSKTTANAIAKKILNNPDYSDITFTEANCKVNEKTEFSVQTQETDYQYLCRLADKHKANFFYDGQQLHFAPLQSVNSDLIRLTNDKDLFHFRASVNLSPVEFKVSAYHLTKGNIQNKTFQMQAEGNQLVKTAFQKSANYPEADIKLNYGISDEKELIAVVEDLATRQTNSLVTISGGSNVPNIKVGSILDIRGGKSALPGFDEKENFTVTHVTHSISGGGSSYSNSFSAIPDDNSCPVNMPGASAKLSGPLQAKVVETNDPERLGRVQVQFLMDENKSVSPWMRVLTPFTSNGGHFFMPEKGEIVMVFFEDFNPEKSPFVMGSFFNANQKADKWQDDNNRKKGFQTGNINIIFDENDGSLTFNAKSIVMKTEEGILFEGGKEIKQKADNIKLDAKQKTEVAGAQGVKVSGARIDLN